jgi:tetratricopeptide (TPR) repeat protein
VNDGDLGRKIGDGLAEATRRQIAGESPAAIQILEKLETVARAAKHPGLAYLLIQKAGWLRELGRKKEANTALDEAESVCQAMPPKTAPFPGLRMEQGIVARQAGDLPKAESLLREARDLAKGTAIEVMVMSDILANLSSVYADQGRLKEAQSALLEALQFDQKTNDPRALASNLNMLGLRYLNAGDSKTARVYLTRSKEIASEAGLSKELTDANLNLAIVSDEEGQMLEAKAGFQAALADAERTGRQPDIASVKSSLGTVAVREGRFEEARRMLTEALEIHSALGLAEFCVIDLVNLTRSDLSLNDPQQALHHARAALAMVEVHGLVQLLWAAHYCVATTQAAALSQQETPDPNAVNEVLASYEKAVDAIEMMRTGIGRPEERERILVNKEMVYAEGMMLAGVLHLGTIAWTFAERSRGRSFLDSLGATRIGNQAAKHPLGVRRADLTAKLLELHDMTCPEARALVDELRVVRSLISAEAPTVAAVTESQLPGIQEVAAVIPPDTAVVEFFRGPGNRLTAFVINQKGLCAMNTVDCGDNDLVGLVDQFRAEVQYGVPDEPTGKLLFLLLFGEVWSAIEPVGRLFIVPHRELHYVPMAALWFDNSGEGPNRLYMCQRFQVSVVPSASYLVYILKQQRRAPPMTQSLVLGNPTQDLPAAEAEAAAVAKLLRVKPVLGAKALRDRVLHLVEMQAVVHIASHGTYDEHDPLLSGLLLADGRLSVEDLLDARIPADLLALSGCLTGISEQQPGDELVGLARAALAAGVPSIITTLWEVPDDPTREFFARFYGYLLKGMGKDEAIGAAQRSMLADERYSKPANWAPYVLIGDCR